MHSLRDKDDPRGNSLQPRVDNIIDYHVPLTIEDELFGTPTSGQSGLVTDYMPDWEEDYYRGLHGK